MLACQGLDSTTRRTVIQFSLPAQTISAQRAVFLLELDAHEHKRLHSRISCLVQNPSAPGPTFESAFDEVHTAYQNYRKDITLVHTSNSHFDDWMNQSRADLHLLLTATPAGP